MNKSNSSIKFTDMPNVVRVDFNLFAVIRPDSSSIAEGTLRSVAERLADQWTAACEALNTAP